MKSLKIILFSLLLIFISCGDKQDKKEEIPVKKIEQPTEVVQVIAENPLVFSVQIGAFSKANQKFAAIENVVVSNENGLFTYRLGAFETYKEARDSRRKLRNSYPGAFIQAVKDGKRIDIKNALKSK